MYRKLRQAGGVEVVDYFVTITCYIFGYIIRKLISIHINVTAFNRIVLECLRCRMRLVDCSDVCIPIHSLVVNWMSASYLLH